MSIVRELYPELSEESFAAFVEAYGADNSSVSSTPVADVDDELLSRARSWAGEPESSPFQRYLRHRSLDALEAFPAAAAAACFADPTVALTTFLDDLEGRLRGVSLRVLIVGLSTARDAGTLVGDTSAARYEAFVSRCCDVGLSEASGRDVTAWEGLCRMLVAQQVAVLGTLCARIAADHEALQRRFGIRDGARVLHLEVGQGDRHHHGSSVTQLTFDDGTRVVYKPRSVAAEAAYSRLADELNTRMGTDLTAPVVLDCVDHGYTGFLETAPPDRSPGELSRRMGELLAVLFALNARDMHHENIILTERGPAPVDLETLLHPHGVDRWSGQESPESAHRISREGVGAMGVLPAAIGRADADTYVDIGFLGSDSGAATSPIKMLSVVDPFTDRMRLTLDHVPVLARAPIAAGVRAGEASEFALAMADRFGEVLRQIRDDLAWWSRHVVEAFSATTVRYIHQPTWLYGQVLRSSFSAAALDSPDVRESVLARVGLQTDTRSMALTRDDVRQMRHADVPYYSIRALETEIRDDEGTGLGVHVEESPLAGALAKVARLGEERIAAEEAAIVLSLISRVPATEDPHVDLEPPMSAPNVSGVALEATLRDLGRRLANQLRPGRGPEEPATWVGPGIGSHHARPWIVEPLGPGLYMGSPGPALALLGVELLGPQPQEFGRATSLFDAWAEVVGTRPDELSPHPAGRVSVHNGLAGLAWALCAGGDLAARPDWTRAGHLLFSRIVEETARPGARPGVDVLDGLSGLVLALGASPINADLCATVGESLASLLEEGHGLAAVTASTGAAHGVAGVLSALALTPRADDDRHRDLIRGLWERLETAYDVTERRWWSSADENRAFGQVWCHGTPGILQALLAVRTLEAIDPELVSARLGAAVSAILDDGFGRPLTWCHGDLGNYDMLRAALPWVEDRALAVRAARELTLIERTALTAERMEALLGDRTQRYNYAFGAMVGAGGVLLHLLGRVGGPIISPTRLTYSRGVSDV